MAKNQSIAILLEIPAPAAVIIQYLKESGKADISPR